MPEETTGICPRNGQPCKDIIEVCTRVEHLEEQQKSTTKKVGDIEVSVREILEFQGGTKVYVTEIKQQITNLENRLFTFMGDLVKNLTNNDTQNEKTAATEREKNLDRWLGFAKWILGLTIVAIVAYLFNQK